MNILDSIKAVAASIQLSKPADGKLPVSFDGHFSVVDSRLHFDGAVSIKGGLSVDLPGDTDALVAGLGNMLVGGNSPVPLPPLSN